MSSEQRRESLKSLFLSSSQIIGKPGKAAQKWQNQFGFLKIQQQHNIISQSQLPKDGLNGAANMKL